MNTQTKQTHFPLVFVLTIFAVIVLAACGSQPAAVPAAQAAPAATAVPAATAAVAQVAVPAATAVESQPTAGAAQSVASSSAVTTQGAVSFSKDLLPILQESCISCHGGEKTAKALDLKTFDSLMVGSQTGAVITPGNADGSKLVQAIKSGKMPKRGAKLTPDQVQLFVDWVNAGATNN